MNRRSKAFTLVEVMVAVVIVATSVPASLLTIQWARVQSQNLSLEMVGQNMAVALMEMIKRSGYDAVAYGQDLPNLLTASTGSKLLEFPRTPIAGGAQAGKLPAGAAGGATSPAAYKYTKGLTPSTALTSNTNYLTLSADQIAALNGYANNASVPSGVGLLNPNMAWGVYIQAQTNPVMTNPVKLVVVVIKWKSNYGGRVRFATVSTLISSKVQRI